MDDKLIERVRKMEEDFNAVRSIMDGMEKSVDAFESVLQKIDGLCAYRDTGRWLKDFESDERGELPAGLPRGVLSEDALDDLLVEISQLRARMKKLSDNERVTAEEGVSAIDGILQYNKRFVADEAYEPYRTDKYPSKKLAVLSCMDTRLTELLPKALGLRNGDAKIIKNAGGLILSETDSAIRSLLVGIYELGVKEVMVVHHSTCGACHMSYEAFKPHMLEKGIPASVLEEWEAKGIASWLEGFHDTEASVRKTVAAIVNHPLVPRDIQVRGFIIDSVTGALTEVE